MSETTEHGILRELGYPAIETLDAAEAHAAMLEHWRFHFLFTDVLLPDGKTGPDVARETRKHLDEMFDFASN